MSVFGSTSSSRVKLVAWVDEVEGGPPQVSLTILAKPNWRMHKVQSALVQAYKIYLEDYPEFSELYTIAQWKAFPPKPAFDETDRVSDIVEKAKGIPGPNIHIWAAVKSTSEGKHATTAATTPANNSSRKRTSNDSAIELLDRPTSTKKIKTGRSVPGTLTRPTRTIPSPLDNRKDAPRESVYEIADDSDVGVEGRPDDLLSFKRAREAGARRGPLVGPPIVYCTPSTSTARASVPSRSSYSETKVQSASTTHSNSPIESEEGVKAGGLWSKRENDLMLTEIIKNGTDTPTVTLRDTLFPGRTTEGIRKRRKKMQIEYASGKHGRQVAPSLPLTKTPSSSKTPSKSTVSAKTPAKSRAASSSRTPMTSKIAKFKSLPGLKTPSTAKTPSRFRTTTPRRIREDSPCVLIDIVHDASQTQLEVRPGGAVRYITPKSSQAVPKETTSAAPTYSMLSETHRPEFGNTKNIDEDEEILHELSSSPPPAISPCIPSKSFQKFLQDAHAAVALEEHAAEDQLRQDQMVRPAEFEDANESSNLAIPSSPPPNFLQKFATKTSLAISGVFNSSSPEKIRSPSPGTAAAWIECEKLASSTMRSSPPWPDQTPIAKFAIAQAMAISPAVHTSHVEKTDRKQSEHAKQVDKEYRKPAQTPRTLAFKARTPRSLSISVSKAKPSALPLQPAPSSSDGDNNDSSADENDSDMGVDNGANQDLRVAKGTESVAKPDPKEAVTTSSADSSDDSSDDEEAIQSRTGTAKSKSLLQTRLSSHQNDEKRRLGNVESRDDILSEQQLHTNAGTGAVSENSSEVESANDDADGSSASGDNISHGDRGNDEYGTHSETSISSHGPDSKASRGPTKHTPSRRLVAVVVPSRAGDKTTSPFAEQVQRIIATAVGTMVETTNNFTFEEDKSAASDKDVFVSFDEQLKQITDGVVGNMAKLFQ